MQICLLNTITWFISLFDFLCFDSGDDSANIGSADSVAFSVPSPKIHKTSR